MRDVSGEIATKPIPQFPGYQVTHDGRVQTRWRRGTSVWATEWRDLSGRATGKGYLGVTLCNGTKRWNVRIHRLIAIAFVPNPDALPCVRHLDNNPTNNSVANLAWGTYVDNEDDKHRHGTWDARRGGAKLTQHQRDEALARHRIGESAVSIAADLGVSGSTISRLINGVTWRLACAS